MSGNYPVGLPRQPHAVHCLVDNVGYGQNVGLQRCRPQQWAKSGEVLLCPFVWGSWVPI